MRKEPEFRIGTAKRLGTSGSLRDSSRTPGPANYNTIEAKSSVMPS